MDAVRNGIGDAQRIEHQIGQAVGKGLRFAFEREHAALADLALSRGARPLPLALLQR